MTSHHDAKVSVIICTLNETPNLPTVLPQIPSGLDEVLLVDGHSTDGTVELARELRPDIRLLCQPGTGKGDALKYGIQEAQGDIIVTLDADGETDPSEISRFVEPLLQGYDFAKGSRLAQGRPARMPRHRWFGNKVLAITFNLLYGTRFTDICSGYNAFRKSAFLQLQLKYDNCEMEQQMLAKATKAGMRVVEVPHSSPGRLAGSSKIKGIRQGFIDWFVIIKERFSK